MQLRSSPKVSSFRAQSLTVDVLCNALDIATTHRHCFALPHAWKYPSICFQAVKSKAPCRPVIKSLRMGDDEYLKNNVQMFLLLPQGSSAHNTEGPVLFRRYLDGTSSSFLTAASRHQRTSYGGTRVALLVSPWYTILLHEPHGKILGE